MVSWIPKHSVLLFRLQLVLVGIYLLPIGWCKTVFHRSEGVFEDWINKFHGVSLDLHIGQPIKALVLAGALLQFRYSPNDNQPYGFMIHKQINNLKQLID